MHSSRNSDRDRQTPSLLKLIETVPKNTDRPNTTAFGITANKHYLIIYISAVVHPSMAVESVAAAVHDRVLSNDKIIELIYLHKRLSAVVAAALVNHTWFVLFLRSSLGIQNKVHRQMQKKEHNSSIISSSDIIC